MDGKSTNSEEVAQILDDLKAGKKVEREPVYSQTANSHGENDYGNSYVEINLTAQHLFLYKDGVLVTESDFVSGNVAKGHATPGGAFMLTYKTLKLFYVDRIMKLLLHIGCHLTATSSI